jgi:ribosomal protein S18 acetylase RimI-like enzyme
MEAIEDEVRKLGISKIGLHVFGFNAAARSLYDKLGFEVTDTSMEKNI